MSAVNLIAQATRAAQQLGSKVGNEPISLSAAKLQSALPEAAVFGEEAAIIQLYRSKKGKQEVRGSTLRVWRGEEGDPLLLDAALEPIETSVSFQSWQVEGFSGSATIAAGDRTFVVGLALQLERPSERIEGEGKPDAKLLKPRPKRAIAFSALEVGVTYSVCEMKNGLCTIEYPDGKREQYYLSGRLKKLIEQEGNALPFAFQIDGWETVDIDGASVRAPILSKAGTNSPDFATIL